ncbi:MAG: hypothetical protein R3F20_06330 [Planctomycetota bacterium]
MVRYEIVLLPVALLLAGSLLIPFCRREAEPESRTESSIQTAWERILDLQRAEVREAVPVRDLGDLLRETGQLGWVGDWLPELAAIERGAGVEGEIPEVARQVLSRCGSLEFPVLGPRAPRFSALYRHLDLEGWVPGPDPADQHRGARAAGDLLFSTRDDRLHLEVLVRLVLATRDSAALTTLLRLARADRNAFPMRIFPGALNGFTINAALVRSLEARPDDAVAALQRRFAPTFRQVCAERVRTETRRLFLRTGRTIEDGGGVAIVRRLEKDVETLRRITRDFREVGPLRQAAALCEDPFQLLAAPPDRFLGLAPVTTTSEAR